MADVIIIVGNAAMEPELVLLAQSLDKKYCNQKAKVIQLADTGSLGTGGLGSVFLVGHANIQSIGEVDAKILTTQQPWGGILGNAQAIFLAGCSTSDELQQLQPDQGFIPSTLGKIVKQKYSKARVFATPSVLYRLPNGDLVVAKSLVQGITDPTQIWVEMK